MPTLPMYKSRLIGRIRLACQCNALPGSHPSRRRYSSTQHQQPERLNWAELYYASTLAKWSGLCYHPQQDLPGLVEAEGLQLVAHGRTKYTSWYIADGSVDMAAAYNQLMAPRHKRPEGSSSSMGVGSNSAHGRSLGASPASSHGSSSSHSTEPPLVPSSKAAPQGTLEAAAASVDAQAASSSGQHLPFSMLSERRRFVFIRGVQWGAPDTSLSTLSSALSNFWPTPFAPTLTSPHGALVAHAGVASLAYDLFEQISPHLLPLSATSSASQPAAPAASLSATTSATSPTSPTGASPPAKTGQQPPAASSSSQQLASQPPATCSSLPLSFAGHSLGGALGLLSLALAVLHGLRSPQSVSVHTFGSPPMLSHKDGGGGHRVLQVLKLPDAAVRSFVLEHDPVPRALITADPAFHALKQYAPVQQLLQARSWLLGSGLFGGQDASATSPFTSNRFLFESVGGVYLLRAGSRVTPVGSVSDSEELMRMAIADVLARPARALQAWLDHHHSSYSHDLEAAALLELRRGLRQQAVAAGTAASAAVTAGVAGVTGTGHSNS